MFHTQGPTEVNNEVSTPLQHWVKNNKRKILLVGGGVLIAWLSLGIYLHVQVVQSRAKVEQNRIEQARHDEFLRRGAQYKQALQQRTAPSRVRNAFDGR